MMFTLSSNLTDSLLVFETVLPIVFSILVINIIKAKYNFKSYWHEFLIEYLIIVVPVILCVTILNEYITYIVIASIIVVCLFILYSGISIEQCLKICWTKPYQYITYSRSIIYILTSVCILAVDFQIFPKQFAKSEEFGCTLMDTGIGFFIFSMGIVPSKRSFLHIFKTVAILLILGFVRTSVIIIIGYHQEITEYGLHWNAFFTLAFTKLFSYILISIFPRQNKLFLAILIGVLNDILLNYYFEEYVMNQFMKRDTIFKANKEGILSLPGCVMLYLFSNCIYDTLNLNKKNNSIYVKELLKKIINILLIGGLIFLIFTLYLSTYKVSRRIANAGYVLWIAWMSITMGALLMIVEILSRLYYLMHKREFGTIKLMESINSNTLTYFLLSNVLTGIVNIFFNPGNKSYMQSILILIIYTFVVNFLCSHYLKYVSIKKKKL